MSGYQPPSPADTRVAPVYNQLLARIEAIGRELGRIEAAHAALADALARLDARLVALGGEPSGMARTPAPSAPPPTPVPAPPPGLERLVTRMELLGRSLGRAEVNPASSRPPAAPRPTYARRPEPRPVRAATLAVPQVASLRAADATAPSGAATMALVAGTLGTGNAAFKPIVSRSTSTPDVAPDVAEAAPSVAPPPGPVALAMSRGQRRGRSRAATYGAVVIVLLIVLTAMVTLASPNDPAPVTATATPAIPTPGATLAPLDPDATRLPGVYTLIGTPTPAASPTRTPPPSPTATVTPTATRVPSPTRTPSPLPTSTPKPTPSLSPTATPPPPTPTPEPPPPTATPEPPPPTATPVNPTPGVGATRADIETRLGAPSGTRSTGVVEYQGGTLAVRYSTGDKVLWISLNMRNAVDPSRGAADAFAAAWRPPDATFVRTSTRTAALERQIYRSAGVTAALAGGDTRGRNGGIFVEEFELDPASGRVLSITLAVGDAF